MFTVQIQDLELIEGGYAIAPTIRGQFNFPIHAGTGAAASAAIYFEVEPGRAVPPHTHTAEEILFLVQGTAGVTVGDEKGVFSEGGLILIPSLVRHGVRSTGGDILRCVGFFASAALLTTFDEPLTPIDSRVLIVPLPEEMLQPNLAVKANARSQ